jgi:tetratricopeptide (TPR) repeat protein
MHLASPDQIPALAKELKKRILGSLPGHAREAGPTRKVTLGYFPPAMRLVGVEEYHAQLLGRQTGLTWVTGAPGTGKTVLAADFVRRFSNRFQEVFWIGPLPEMDVSKLLEGVFERREGLTGVLFVVDASSVGTLNAPWFGQLSRIWSVSNRVIVTTQDVSDARPFANEEQDLIILPKHGKVVDHVRRRWETLLADAPTAPVPIIRDADGADPRLWRRATPVRSWRTDLTKSSAGLTFGDLGHDFLTSFSPHELERLSLAAFAPDLWLGGRFTEIYRDSVDDAIIQRLLLMKAIERSPDGLVLHHLVAHGLRRAADAALCEAFALKILAGLPSPSAKAAIEVLPGVSHFLDLVRTSSPTGAQPFVDLAIWIASVWRAAGSPHQAQQAADYARELSDSLDDPESRVRAMNLLAGVAADRGLYHESASIERRAIEIGAAALGATHPTTLAAIANFASSLSQQGQHAEAISVLRFVLSQLDSNTAVASDVRAAVLIALGSAYSDAGLGDEALDLLSGLHSDDRAVQAQVEQEKVAALLAAERASEALPLLHAAISRAEKETDQIDLLGRLALAQAKSGDYAEALQTQYDSVRMAQTYLGDVHVSTMGAQANLAVLLGATGNHEESLKIASSVAEQHRATLGADSQLYLAALIICGTAAERLGLTELAAEEYRLATEGYARSMGENAIPTLRARERLTRLLRLSGSSDSANLMAIELLADVRGVLPDDHPMTRRIEDLAVGMSSKGSDRSEA